MERISSLTRRLALATNRSEQVQLQFELDAVQRRLNDANREIFGRKSERRGRPDEDKPPKPKEPKKRSGHGPTPQPKLPRSPQPHLLDPADRVCPKCRPPHPLEPWEGKTVDSEEVTVIERTFKIVLHQRQVYRCSRCGHIETALGPDRLIPGGRYSTEFAATVAADKYQDHMPLSRQAKRMGQRGLTVTSQTLWDQIDALYVLLLNNYLTLQKRILSSDLVYADETSWRLMGKGRTKKWWAWVVSDGQRVFFLLKSTRGKQAAVALFRDYAGIVMADRYSVYKALEKALSKAGGTQLDLIERGGNQEKQPPPNYTLAACWMHGRRGFVKAERHGDVAASTALDLIAKLYAIEKRAQEEVQSNPEGEARHAALMEARRRLRDAESRQVIAELRACLDSVHRVSKLPLDDAIRWVNNGWTHLTRFLDDPRIPMDIGHAERAIRGAVLGRKTYAGSRSVGGTRVAALFYSFAESCHLADVSLRDTLVEAAKRAMKDREAAFLPEDYARMLAERERSDGAEIG